MFGIKLINEKLKVLKESTEFLLIGQIEQLHETLDTFKTLEEIKERLDTMTETLASFDESLLSIEESLNEFEERLEALEAKKKK
jgi:prefoldin subunit 5